MPSYNLDFFEAWDELDDENTTQQDNIYSSRQSRLTSIKKNQFLDKDPLSENELKKANEELNSKLPKNIVWKQLANVIKTYSINKINDTELKMAGIYIIKRRATCQIYVGQAFVLGIRLAQHIDNTNRKQFVDKAIAKFGKESFDYAIIESFDLHTSPREAFVNDLNKLNELEIKYIKKLNCYSNISSDDYDLNDYEIRNNSNYNLTRGGKAIRSPRSKLTSDEVIKVGRDLYHGLSFNEIRQLEDINVSDDVFRDIINKETKDYTSILSNFIEKCTNINIDDFYFVLKNKQNDTNTPNMLLGTVGTYKDKNLYFKSLSDTARKLKDIYNLAVSENSIWSKLVTRMRNDLPLILKNRATGEQDEFDIITPLLNNNKSSSGHGRFISNTKNNDIEGILPKSGDWWIVDANKWPQHDINTLKDLIDKGYSVTDISKMAEANEITLHSSNRDAIKDQCRINNIQFEQNNKDVKIVVYGKNIKTGKIEQFESAADAVRKLNFNKYGGSSISKAAKGKYSSADGHTYNGYYWTYDLNDLN